jgi:hypothetical protein
MSKHAQRETEKREQEMEALNTLGAQLDAIEVITNPGVFINPVDRTALNHLLSALRKTTVPFEASPLTRPASDASSSRGGGATQGLAALRASDDWSEAAALEAKLSGTISYAHKRMQRLRQHKTREEASASDGSRVATTPGSTRRENMLKKRFIESAHWLEVHREQQQQKDLVQAPAGQKLEAAQKAARRRAQAD